MFKFTEMENVWLLIHKSGIDVEAFNPLFPVK